MTQKNLLHRPFELICHDRIDKLANMAGVMPRQITSLLYPEHLVIRVTSHLAILGHPVRAIQEDKMMLTEKRAMCGR